MRTISFDSGMKQAYRDLKFSNTTIISEHEGPHFAFDEQDWFCDTFIYLTTRKTNGIVGITFDGTTFIGGHKDVGGFNITIQPDTNLVSGIKFINSDWRDAGSFYSENYSGFDSIQSKDSVLSIIGPTFTNTIGIQSK
jgi:hypothetical protein